MRLIEANKEHNRRFHELPESDRLDFLLQGYTQVFPDTKVEYLPGDFTLATSPESLATAHRMIKPLRQSMMKAARNTIDNLNFLMTRFAMLNDPKYENHVKELTLTRFDYMFMMGETELTQNPQLVSDFYTRRAKPELIKPALEKLGEKAIEYEHLAERIIEHPVFAQVVGDDTVTYRFRARLHTLVENNDYSKEQAAGTLMDEGFDLVACDFNKWHKTETDWDVQRGDKQYKISGNQTKWLTSFVAQRKKKQSLEEITTDTTASNEAPLVPIDEEEPSEEYECSKEALETLDKKVQYTITEQGEKTPIWIRELTALTSDHSKLALDSANLVEAKMWDYMWGGKFSDLAYQLKGANPDGKTRKGLNYNKWALTHVEHKDKINPVLAQDSYAMIVAGDILVGDLDTAAADLHAEELQIYRNDDKLRAAVNLAWELMQQPGESDEPDEYEPPRGYLYHVASTFADFLKNNPSATPYLTLVNATAKTQLGKDEEKILASIKSFDNVERIYTQIGRADKIKERYLEIFDETYDSDTKFISIQSEVRGTVDTIQHPTFRKHVNDHEIGERLYAAVEKTLHIKDEYDPEREESGTKKMVLTLYQNSILRPYLEERVDVCAMVNGMIDDVVDRRDELLTKPLSLKHQGELSIIPSRTIEAYMLADRYRDVANPQKLQGLVAYLLALNSEMTVHNSFSLTTMIIDSVEKEADPNYQRPDYFPNPKLGMEEQRIAFLSNVYEREKELGGLDQEKAATGVTNVIFRGTFVEPSRFYPRLDSVLRFLESPLAELLPTEGLGATAIKEYRILNDFVRG